LVALSLGMDSFVICIHWVQVSQMLKRHPVKMAWAFLLCNCPFSGTMLCKQQQPWPAWTSNLVSSTQEDYQASPGILLSSYTVNPLETVMWINHRALLICFSSLKGHFSFTDDDQCLVLLTVPLLCFVVSWVCSSLVSSRRQVNLLLLWLLMSALPVSLHARHVVTHWAQTIN
jgi:hypothetical protein